MRVDSFVFYTSWLEAIEELDEEDQLKTIKAILRYQAFHEEPEAKGSAMAIFKMARPVIDEMYNRRVASIENGKKGGRPKSAQLENAGDKAERKTKPIQNLEKPMHNLNENVNENGNENVNVKHRFIPPTLEEIVQYCQERQNNVDPKKFYDYFSTGNWKDSKGVPVKNWKQKMITWEKYNPVRTEIEALPVYNDKNNVKITENDLNDILKEMRRI